MDRIDWKLIIVATIFSLVMGVSAVIDLYNQLGNSAFIIYIGAILFIIKCIYTTKRGIQDEDT